MEEVIAVPEDEVTGSTKAPRKGFPILAWSAIVVLVAGIYFLQTYRSEKRAAADNDQAGVVTLQLQARYIVGAAQFTSRSALESEALKLNNGPIQRRLRVIILVGELAGPVRAEELLSDLESQIAKQAIEPSAKDKSLEEVLKRLYADYSQERFDAPSVQPHERETLHRALGWFGDLALVPADGPDQEARKQVLVPALVTA